MPKIKDPKNLSKVNRAIYNFITMYLHATEKTLSFSLLYVIPPAIYFFVLFPYRVALTELFKPSIFEQILHFILFNFLCLNVYGNMIMNIITDTKVKPVVLRPECHEFCEDCRMVRPKNSWHCKTCKVCVLERDHHCYIFSRCIAQNNKRYYVLYLGYVSILMAYLSVLTFCYLHRVMTNTIFWEVLILFVFKFLPLTSYHNYLLFLLLNLVFLVWSACMFAVQMMLILRGHSAYEDKVYNEMKKKNMQLITSDDDMKKNLLQVFGTRWYVAIVFPFVISPLLK